MISSDVINTDKFLTLPLATRGLYMHLNVVADDDGFISSALMTTRAADGNVSMLDELVSGGYLIRFESGLYLIRHWLLNNYLRNDRYNASIYTKERSLIRVVDHVYYVPGEPLWTQNGSNLDTQRSKDKDKKEKNNKSASGSTKKQNSFNKIEQHDYDFDALEEKLLKAD